MVSQPSCHKIISCLDRSELLHTEVHISAKKIIFFLKQYIPHIDWDNYLQYITSEYIRETTSASDDIGRSHDNQTKII